MKDSLFVKICLIIIILLLGLNFLFSHSKSNSNPDRYSMYVYDQGEAIFKLDKQTGQIWAITLTTGEGLPLGTIFELGEVRLKPITLRGFIESASRDSFLRSIPPREFIERTSNLIFENK